MSPPLALVYRLILSRSCSSVWGRGIDNDHGIFVLQLQPFVLALQSRHDEPQTFAILLQSLHLGSPLRSICIPFLSLTVELGFGRITFAGNLRPLMVGVLQSRRMIFISFMQDTDAFMQVVYLEP